MQHAVYVRSRRSKRRAWSKVNECKYWLISPFLILLYWFSRHWVEWIHACYSVCSLAYLYIVLCAVIWGNTDIPCWTTRAKLIFLMVGIAPSVSSGSCGGSRYFNDPQDRPCLYVGGNFVSRSLFDRFVSAAMLNALCSNGSMCVRAGDVCVIFDEGALIRTDCCCWSGSHVSIWIRACEPPHRYQESHMRYIRWKRSAKVLNGVYRKCNHCNVATFTRNSLLRRCF